MEPHASPIRPSRFSGMGLSVLAVVGVAILCVTLLVTDVRRVHRRETGDFEHFYYAADAVKRGSDPYAAWTRGYIYPPLIAFAFQPLVPLGRDRAAAAMLVVNVALTLLAVALATDELLRRFRAPRRVWSVTMVSLLALLMDVDKVKGEWQMWQTDVFMLLLFVLALRWLDRRPVAAGIALAVAVNIKYLPLLAVPYLVLRRRYVVLIAMGAGCVAFAALPAISRGWTGNLHDWRTAADGLVAMAGGRPAGPERAEVHGVADALSCSITSAIARGTRWTGSTAIGFALATLVGLVALGVAAGWYARVGLSLLRPTPGPRAFADALVGAEWVALVAGILAFAPQTNTRHLFDALLFTASAAVLLLFARPRVNRLPLALGTGAMVLGFLLPPGSRTRIGELTPALRWLRVGGPCWCLLVAAMSLLWTGLAQARALGQVEGS